MQSRYYDPEVGRFLNADELVSTGQGIIGCNMFTYCLNNPLVYDDSLGNSATVAGAILGGFWGLVGALTNDESDKQNTLSDVLACVAIGAVAGAAAGFVADLSVATCGVGTAFLVSAAAGGVAGFTNSVVSQKILDNDVDFAKASFDGAVGAVMGGTCTVMNDLWTPSANTLIEGVNYVNALVTTEMTMITTQGYVGAGLAFDVGATAVTSFGSWFASVIYDGYKRMTVR